MNSTQALYTQMRTALSQNPSLVFWPLQMMLRELITDWQERNMIARLIIEQICEIPVEEQAAQGVNDLLGTKASMVPNLLFNRASQVWDQIKFHLRGKDILDFGCGDGKVGQIITNRSERKVVQYDVANYRTNVQLPFSTDWAMLENQIFDTALALVVFHHCDDPETEIARLRKVTKRLVVIESVTDESTMPWAMQAFVDWMYNRGLHPGAAIPVPGQFKKVEEWREVFARNGFRVVHEEDLGIDLPVVPEHHHLFVLQ